MVPALPSRRAGDAGASNALRNARARAGRWLQADAAATPTTPAVAD
ncbi:hypothetical protein CBM2625_A180113 [Cupriavidus taiwanensis]|nr:hypothetical protein CBM2614_A220112 [Cupriavidus taiwanensis]SPA05144.1 hypothetical protein CBM2625_A180113 [Cupriavidus taiwanensis]